MDCHGLLGLFQRANYNVLMWFWTLLFSLQVCSSLGMKGRFLGAVCQRRPRPILYVVTVIKDLWSAVRAEGDPGRRNTETDMILLEQDLAARPLLLPNSCWEDRSRRRATPHRPLPQIRGAFWGPRPEHGPGCFMLGRFHNIPNPISKLTRIFPCLDWLWSSVIPFIEGLDKERCSSIEEGLEPAGGMHQRGGLFPFGGGTSRLKDAVTWKSNMHGSWGGEKACTSCIFRM